MDGFNQNQNEQTYNITSEIPIPDMPKKRKAGRVLIIAACVIAVLGIAGISAWAYYTTRQLYRLAKGFQNLRTEMEEMQNPLADKVGLADILTGMEEEGSHLETKLDFQSDKLPNSITLGIDTDCYKDVQAKELDAVTNISVMNYDVAELKIYGTEDVICFSIPKLFIENMYFNTENVVSQYNDSFFAGLLGQSDMEDFSIELFPDYGESLSPWELLNSSELVERYAEDVQRCSENMTVEKVSKNVYRIVFRQQDVEALARDVMSDSAFFYEKAGVDVEELLAEYSQLISSDVSLLFTLDDKNRFESIELEREAAVLDGESSLNGELFFLGEERTIEKIQGKMTIADTGGEETEITGQVEQSREEDDYQTDMDLVYRMEDYEASMKMSLGCDTAQDDFDMTLSVKDGQDTVEIAAEGSLDDIVQGESFSLDLDDFTFARNGEQLFQIRGNIEIEILTEEVNSEKVKSDVTAETPVFELNYGDLVGIAYKIISKYGSILKMLGYE